MVALGAVERIEESPVEQIARTAGRMRVTLGDRILPLEGCTEIPDRERVKLLRLTDGENEVAYALDEVLDIVSLDANVRSTEKAGPIAGVVAYAAHAPLDWDWQMPAVTTLALVLAGALLALGELSERPRAPVRGEAAGAR